MNEELSRLLDLAAADKELKERLLATKGSSSEASDICAVASEYNIKMNPAELISEGEEFCAAMLRSVNGGGVDSLDSWDDAIELFYAALAVI